MYEVKIVFPKSNSDFRIVDTLDQVVAILEEYRNSSKVEVIVREVDDDISSLFDWAAE